MTDAELLTLYDNQYRAADPHLAGLHAVYDAAVLAEREACAKVCEDEAEKWEGEDGPICHEARLCAVNIRARGEK